MTLALFNNSKAPSRKSEEIFHLRPSPHDPHKRMIGSRDRAGESSWCAVLKAGSMGANRGSAGNGGAFGRWLGKPPCPLCSIQSLVDASNDETPALAVPLAAANSLHA